MSVLRLLLTLILRLFGFRSGDEAQGKGSGTEADSKRITLRYDVVLAENQSPIVLEPDPSTLESIGEGLWKVMSKPLRIGLPHDFFASLVHVDGRRAMRWSEKGGVEAVSFDVYGSVSFRGETGVFRYRYAVDGTKLQPAEFIIPPLEWRIKKTASGFEGTTTPDGNIYYVETYEIGLPSHLVKDILYTGAGGDISSVEAWVEEWSGVHTILFSLDMDKAYRLVKQVEQAAEKQRLDTRPPETVTEDAEWVWPTAEAVAAGEKLLEKYQGVEAEEPEPVAGGHRIVFELDETSIPYMLVPILLCRVGDGEWRPVYVGGRYVFRETYVAQGQPVYVQLYVFLSRSINAVAYRGIWIHVDQDMPVEGGGYVHERVHKTAVLNAVNSTAGIMFYADSPYPNRSYVVRVGLVEAKMPSWAPKASIRYDSGVFHVLVKTLAELDTEPPLQKSYGNVDTVVAVVDKAGVTKTRAELLSDAGGVMEWSQAVSLEDGDRVIIRLNCVRDRRGDFALDFMGGVRELEYVYRGGVFEREAAEDG